MIVRVHQFQPITISAVLLPFLVFICSTFVGDYFKMSSLPTPTLKSIENRNHQDFDYSDPKIDPQMASDFVSYVLANSLDFKPETLDNNHAKSQGWMTKTACCKMNSYFWAKPKIFNGLCFVQTNILSLRSEACKTAKVRVNGYFHKHGDPEIAETPMTLEIEVIKEKIGLRFSNILILENIHS